MDLLNAFIRGHFDAIFLGAENDFPRKQLAEFPEVTPMDPSPVRDRALTLP